jgi:hypothetical protein
MEKYNIEPMLRRLMDNLKEYDKDLYNVLSYSNTDIKSVLDSIASRDWYVSLHYINECGKYNALIVTDDDGTGSPEYSYISNYDINPMLVLLDAYVLALRGEASREVEKKAKCSKDTSTECENFNASVHSEPEELDIESRIDDLEERVGELEMHLTYMN